MQRRWYNSSERQVRSDVTSRKAAEKVRMDKVRKEEIIRHVDPQHVDEERWRTHTEEIDEGRYTREKEERTTENKMERRVPTRFAKYWTESGRGDGQGDVEKKDHQSYRRPYIMGKARGKVSK